MVFVYGLFMFVVFGASVIAFRLYGDKLSFFQKEKESISPEEFLKAVSNIQTFPRAEQIHRLMDQLQIEEMSKSDFDKLFFAVAEHRHTLLGELQSREPQSHLFKEISKLTD